MARKQPPAVVATRWIADMRRALIALCLALSACGGQYEIDADKALAQLEARSEVILQRIRDTPVTLQSRELEQLVALFWDLQDQIKRLEDELRERVDKPAEVTPQAAQ